MAIERIDYEKCVSCGTCVNTCSCDVIRMNKTAGKPFIKYKEECCICLYCMEDCPANAIYVAPEKYYKQLSAWE